MTLRTARRQATQPSSGAQYRAARKASLPLPRYIFKRGRTYAVRYTVPAELREAAGRSEVVRSLGTSNLREAIERRDETLEEIRRNLLEPRSAERGSQARGTRKLYPERDDPITGTTITATAHRWLAQSDGIQPSTKAKYRQHLRTFAEFARQQAGRDIEVSEINRKLALDFIEHLKVTPSERTGEKLSARSIGSHQACLASWWRVLDHWGLVDPDMRNPFSSLLRRVAGQRKKADPREKKLRPVTREEAEALLRYIVGNQRLKYQWEMYVTVRLLWVTACRLNEICGRHLEDMDDRGDHIRITIPEAKTEAGKRVVMVVGESDCELLREAMRRALTDEPDCPVANRGMLFPRLRLGGYDRQPSHYLGKALEGARKSLPASCKPHEWDMHSFRRTGVSALVNSREVSREARNLAVGHSNKDDIGVSVYAKRGDLSEVLRATFEALHEELGGSLRTALALS